MTVSKPAGWEALGLQGLTHPLRALARRLADGPGILWSAQARAGALCVGVAVGWKPAIDREQAGLARSPSSIPPIDTEALS